MVQGQTDDVKRSREVSSMSKSTLGPQDATLAVLLDEEPATPLVEYLEKTLNILIIWIDNSDLVGHEAHTLVPNFVHLPHR